MSDDKKSGCCSGGGKKSKKRVDDNKIVFRQKAVDKSVATLDFSRGVKVCFLGDAGVGKSSILNRYVKDEFDSGEAPTIGAAFLTKTHMKDGNSIKFEIWDTAGYHSLAPMYYRGSIAVLIVYDITNPESFGKAKSWVEEIRRACPTCLVMHLVGSKTDLRFMQKVPTEDVQEFAEMNDCAFMEVSAKTGEKVGDLFDNLAKLLWQRRKEAETLVNTA